MTRNIGETFKYLDGTTLKVETSIYNRCTGCYFFDNGCNTKINIVTGSCTGIIFKKVMEDNQKEIRIQVPDGYQIDKEKSTFEKIVFKKISLPKTWKEFCENHEITPEEYRISYGEPRQVATWNVNRDFSAYKDVLPNKEYADGIVALCQLVQLVECYNDGWKPDWTDSTTKHIITCESGVVSAGYTNKYNKILAFRTPELRNEFLVNFRELIETAKMYI